MLIPLTVLLVISSFNWTPARGQTCSLSAGQFLLSTVTMSAESVVHGSTPAARVTWSTTEPPECVTSVRVEFRTSSRGPAVATYTTTNSSQTEVIQTGLQCNTYYYITVVVTGKTSDGIPTALSSRQVQVFVGAPVAVRAEVTADSTSVRVSWQWSHEDVHMCIDLVRVYYQPQGGSLMMYTVSNTTATSATLPNLQCNTEYTIWVYARGGRTGKRSANIKAFLPTRAPPTPTEVTAQFTSVSSVRVAWQWSSSGPAPNCFNTTSVTYHPEGGSELSLQLSDPAASEATLTGLQCNTSYNITVVSIAGKYRRKGVARIEQAMVIRNVKIQVINATALLVSWDQSLWSTHYTLYYSAFSPVLYKVVDESTTVIPSNKTYVAVVIRQLAAGIQHRFQVTASVETQREVCEGEKSMLTEDSRTIFDEAAFHLQMGPVSPCTTWSADKVEKIRSYVHSGIAKAISYQCNCSFSAEFIRNGPFRCWNALNEFTYRSTIVGTKAHNATELVGFLEQWVNTEPALQVDQFELWVGTRCPVPISSLKLKGEGKCL